MATKSVIVTNSEGQSIYVDYTVPGTPLSYFNQASVGDGTSVLSHIDSSALITVIQANVADPYFDSTSELAKVYVYYVHEEGRQQRKVIHDGTALTGSVMWAPGARDGWWYKDKIIAFDHDGAQRVVTRAMIGDQEDSSHSVGIMTLR
jgi:hypothetical protein